MAIISMSCGVFDPVRCPRTFTGPSTLYVARQLLAHMDGAHVHHESETGWSLTWVDESGCEQHLGQTYEQVA